MGLAASQARLLLLTARKSDLEYRAQMISQRKVMLAMQTEEIATTYSEALNNRKLYFTWTTEQNNGATKEELLTYSNFTAEENTYRYRLLDPETNKIACLSLDEASKYVRQADYTDADGVLDTAAYEAAIAEVQKGMIVMPALKNTDYLQQAIQSGALIIQQRSTESVPVTDENGDYVYENEKVVERAVYSWSAVALSGMEDVSSKLYSDDDAKASADYEYQSLLVQNQDKQLDVELKQVETQQKACETEIESVKKVLKANVEKSFNVFS